MFLDFSTHFYQKEYIYGLLKVEANLFFTVTQLQHFKQHCLVPFFSEDQQLTPLKGYQYSQVQCLSDLTDENGLKT